MEFINYDTARSTHSANLTLGEAEWMINNPDFPSDLADRVEHQLRTTFRDLLPPTPNIIDDVPTKAEAPHGLSYEQRTAKLLLNVMMESVVTERFTNTEGIVRPFIPVTLQSEELAVVSEAAHAHRKRYEEVIQNYASQANLGPEWELSPDGPQDSQEDQIFDAQNEIQAANGIITAIAAHLQAAA